MTERPIDEFMDRYKLSLCMECYGRPYVNLVLGEKTRRWHCHCLENKAKYDACIRELEATIEAMEQGTYPRPCDMRNRSVFDSPGSEDRKVEVWKGIAALTEELGRICDASTGILLPSDHWPWDNEWLWSKADKVSRRWVLDYAKTGIRKDNPGWSKYAPSSKRVIRKPRRWRAPLSLRWAFSQVSRPFVWWWCKPTTRPFIRPKRCRRQAWEI